MDKTEKFILAISIGFMMIFIFAILVLSKGMGNEVPECITTVKPYEQGKTVQLDSTTYQLYYVSKMWQFDPYEVELPAGSEVDIFVTSTDVVHGFNIHEKNVNMMAVYGNVNKQTVNFKKPGTYNIYCHEYCGAGHHNMMGRIIIK